MQDFFQLLHASTPIDILNTKLNWRIDSYKIHFIFYKDIILERKKQQLYPFPYLPNNHRQTRLWRVDDTPHNTHQHPPKRNIFPHEMFYKVLNNRWVYKVYLYSRFSVFIKKENNIIWKVLRNHLFCFIITFTFRSSASL